LLRTGTAPIDEPLQLSNHSLGNVATLSKSVGEAAVKKNDVSRMNALAVLRNTEFADSDEEDDVTPLVASHSFGGAQHFKENDREKKVGKRLAKFKLSKCW
jgi:hypothetical protein